MYNWFFLALVAPILWSIINHIDKYILSKYQQGRGVGALFIFSALASVIVLPFLAIFFHSEILNVSKENLLGLLVVGFLSAAAFFYYLKAMDRDEASVVVPLFQFDPVFGYIISFFVLRELLNLNQILASVLILVGIILLSIEIDIDNKFRMKKKVLFWVVISSFLFALSGILFKKLALEDSFWIAIFWQYLGLTIFGLCVLAFYKKFRQDFIIMIKLPQLKFLSLNIVSEVLYI